MRRFFAVLLLAAVAFPASAFDAAKADTVDVSYINKNGEVVSRQIQLVMPEDVTGPVPVVYTPHYEVTEGACGKYLSKGWASACPIDYSRINEELTDDDLVFNNAALHYLRGLPQIDRSRILVSGGSAGGYMALMLDALQLGTCATRAECPLSNIYFNFGHLFTEEAEINRAGGDNPPFKVINMIQDSFLPCLDNFPDREDYARFEKLSPIGLTGCFSSPVLITHFTSDMLVPIDQITRDFTYAQGGPSMPEGFSIRLDGNYPGVLGHSLAEELGDDCKLVKYPVEEVSGTLDLPYDQSYFVNIVVFDDGPAEAFGGHRSGTQPCGFTAMPYLEEMVRLGASRTVKLSAEKMLMLLERYNGESVQLPAHEGVDDSVYGSLVVYRQEIVDELSEWVSNNSRKALRQTASKALSSTDRAHRRALRKVFRQIRRKL